MTAAERFGAAYMTLGLSLRVSHLSRIDAEADRQARDWRVPAQRPASP